MLETSAFVNSLTDNTAEASPATGSDFANDLAERLEVRGLYYSHSATRDPRGLCPTGWRIPTFLEMGFVIGGIEAQYGPEGTALKSSDLWNRQDYVGIKVVPTGIAYPDDSASPNYPEYSGNIFLAPEAIAMLHSQSTYLGSDAVNSGFVDSFGVEVGNEYGATFKFDDGETISVHAVKGAWPGSVRCITSN